jgi:hypothetical protein
MVMEVDIKPLEMRNSREEMGGRNPRDQVLCQLEERSIYLSYRFQVDYSLNFASLALTCGAQHRRMGAYSLMMNLGSPASCDHAQYLCYLFQKALEDRP